MMWEVGVRAEKEHRKETPEQPLVWGHQAGCWESAR